MTQEQHPPFEQSCDLPPYRGILAVDAKGFTDEPGSTHQGISSLIPKLVGLAFTNVGLGEVWEDPAFFGSAGDGFAVGVPTRVLPFLVHPLLGELQQVLARHNGSVRRSEAQIRLRVSLNVGPLPTDATSVFLGGNGKPRNDTHRLLDSKPVKAALEAARPEVTFLAAILSDRVYEDVVLAGYAGRHPAHFLEVAATVEAKKFEERAWLYLPEPSGNLLGDVGRPGADIPKPTGPDIPPASGVGRVRVKENHGQVAGVVHGGMHQGGKP